MQQFVVPQFIDVEDKIFGPITTRQFLMLLVAGMTIFFAYRFGDFSMFIFTLIFSGTIALVFAFVKINGQLFHYFLLNIAQTIRRPSRRIWSKRYTKKDLDYFRKQTIEEKIIEEIQKPEKREHIRDLALLVNTGGFYRPEDDV